MSRIVAFSGVLLFLLSGIIVFDQSFIVSNAIAQAQNSSTTNIFDEVFDPIKDKGKLKDVSEIVGVDAPAGQEGQNIISRAVYALIDFWKQILAVIAVLFIVIAGFKVVTSADDSVIATNKEILTWALIGLVVVLTSDVLVKDILFGSEFTAERTGGAFQDPAAIAQATSAARIQIMGIIAWIQTVVGAVAILIIIISAARVLLNMGNEDMITSQYSVFLSIGLGLIMLALNEVAVRVVYSVQGVEDIGINAARAVVSPDAETGISNIVGFIQYFLQFAALIAFVALVYSGFLMLYYMGNDEQTEKAKKIIYDVVIGLVLIFSAYALSATLISASS